MIFIFDPLKGIMILKNGVDCTCIYFYTWICIIDSIILNIFGVYKNGTILHIYILLSRVI